MKGDKLSQFIIKLIKLTSTGELRWESFIPKDDELPNGEFILDKVYETTVNDRDFQLYRYKYKYYKDEYDFDWLQRIRLELLDSDRKTDYEFDYINSLNDLYDIVREQTSEVIDILDDFLGLKLEILEARYYTPKHSIDVTEIVKNKIINNRLVLVASNEIFDEPEYGVVKQLKIRYSFAGEINEKEITEGQTIVLP